MGEPSPLVYKQLLALKQLEGSLAWEPFRPGVEIARIYSVPDGPAAAFLRYQPGARIAAHEHVGYEHILILSGTQIDRAGENGPGTLIVNPPGSSHQIESPQGCVVLAIWEKPVRFKS